MINKGHPDLHSFSEFEPNDHIQAKKAFKEGFKSDAKFF